jgi:hypothetical protein
MSDMDKEIMDMIATIMRSTVAGEDGGFRVDCEGSTCLFCDEEVSEQVPFRFVARGDEYFVNVPMCKSHEEKFNEDTYRITL